MSNDLSRRSVLALIPGSAALALMPRAAAALTTDSARALIGEVVGEINRIISSGASESAMIAKFEGVFSRYADVPTISRSVLGVAARQASSAQLAAFSDAFRGYMARKYGKRFREFIGGRIEVESAQKIKSFYEVVSTAHLKGEAPFDVRWHVSDKSGRDLFFNLIIEGVNLLTSERAEVGAMLDKRRGDINAMIADLKKAG